MDKRILGKSGLEVSAMGIGCWAIGGQFYFDGKIDGYGQTDDAESIRAVRTAVDLGINFIDTADAYGIGHSEEILGEALSGIRDDIVLATKFGFLGNADTKTLQSVCIDPAYIERACDASLRRLRTDRIDLYQLHVGDISFSQFDSLIEALERLVAKGKIQTYGWSTDVPAAIRMIGSNANCSAIQHEFNLLTNADEILRLCRENHLAAICRSPLAMGFLSGKFDRNTVLGTDDVRGAGHGWTEKVFRNGRPNPHALDTLDAVREILSSNGRTLTQGALAWIWGKSDISIPIPGFKSVKQVTENAKAMEFGALLPAQIAEIDRLLQGIG